MRVVFSILVLLAAAGGVTAAQAQNVGQIHYIRTALDSLEAEFRNLGVQRTWWYQIATLQDDYYRDYTVTLNEAGFIAVGADNDTLSIRISPMENGQPNHWSSDYGTNAASLYFNRAGTYTVRVHVEDCSAAYCYYAVMSGFQ